MSDLFSMGLGVVVGGAVSASYYKSMGSAEAQAKRLGERWENTNKRASAVGDLVRYRSALDGLRRKQGQVGASNTRVARGIADLERRYREAKRAVKAYGIEVGDAARTHRRLQMELKATEHAQRGVALRARGAAGLGRVRGMALGAAGAAYGVGRVLQSGMEREEQRLYLRTVVVAQDGDVEAAVDRMSEHARLYARQSLATESDLLEIGYQLSSAGLDDEVARVGAEIAHRVATVTRGESKGVAGVVGTVMENMAGKLAGTTEEKLSFIGDILAQTQFAYKFDDFAQLGESFKEGVSAAGIYRLSLERTLPALGLLNNAGLEGGRAGTALNAVLRNLTKAAEEFGTEVVREEDGALDLVATIEQLKTKTEHLDANAFGDAMQKVFGEDGLKGIGPLIENIAKLRKGTDAAANAAGTVEEQYGHFLRSSAGEWRQLTSNVAQVGDAFAATLLPAVRWVVGALGKAVDVGRIVVEVWPGVGKAVAVATAGFVGLTAVIALANLGTWVFGATVGALGTVLGVASRATWLWTAAAKVGTAVTWLWNAALWANPLTWVGAAVVAVAGLVWYFWEPISEFFGRLWSTETIQRWIAKVGDVVEAVKGFLRWVGLIDETEAATTANVGDAVAATTAPRNSTRADRRRRRTAAAVGVAVGAALPAAAQPPAVPDPLPAVPDPLPAVPTQDVVAPPAFAVPRSSVRVNANITVNPPPGADEEAIARAVNRQLGEQMRRAAVEAGLSESDG